MRDAQAAVAAGAKPTSSADCDADSPFNATEVNKGKATPDAETHDKESATVRSGPQWRPAGAQYRRGQERRRHGAAHAGSDGTHAGGGQLDGNASSAERSDAQPTVEGRGPEQDVPTAD